MPRKNRLLYLLFLILIVLGIYFLSPREPVSPPPPMPSPETKREQPSVAPPPTPATDEREKQVDELLKTNRLAIGACLMSAKNTKVSKTDLTLVWDSLGNVQKLSLVPDLGPEPKACLLELTKQWKLAPAPDMAPLSVTKRLETQLSSP